ncbi:MAG: hypothetical protein SX243_22845 [Acidobacteriota bacterium]|nr:hypothetical protein [Acidobacteriota bacterium]
MGTSSHSASSSKDSVQGFSWPGLLGTLGGVFLGGVLLFAAWAKILDPSAFADQIRLEGLDFLFSAAVVAAIALVLEVGLGGALLLGIRRLWVLVPTALLVVFFLWLTGRNYWLTEQGLRSASESCGCFGNLVQRSPAEAFWQDLLLLVPPLLLAFLGRRWLSTRWIWPRVAVVAVVTVAALGVAWKSDELPLDNLATRLRPEVKVQELCTAGEEKVCLDLVVPELLEGRHLVILADLEDETFTAAMDQLNAYALDAAGPTLWVLSSAEADEQRRFFWQWGPAFEIRETPEPLMQPLYRQLPRSFTVQDGEVLETYSGLPPLDRLAGTTGVAASATSQEAP